MQFGHCLYCGHLASQRERDISNRQEQFFICPKCGFPLEGFILMSFVAEYPTLMEQFELACDMLEQKAHQ